MVGSVQTEHFLLPPLKMERDGSHMTEAILNLTLEIIYLLTGENYIAFKLSDGLTAPDVRGPRSPGFPPSLIPERSHDKKLMEASSKLIELLTGEERDKDVYMEPMMADPPPLPSPDGSSNRNLSVPRPPFVCSRDLIQEDYQAEDPTDFKVENGERDTFVRRDEECKKEEISADGASKVNGSEEGPSVINSWDNTKEHSQHHNHQGELLNVIKVEGTDDKEEAYVREDDQSNEELISPEISTDGRYIKNDPEEATVISLDSEEEEDVAADLSGDNPMNVIFHPAIPGIDRPSAPPTNGDCFPDRPHPIPDPPSLWGDVIPSCYALNECVTQTAKPPARPKPQKMTPEPFTCSECGKSFSHKSNLDVHERIHNGQRPYPCSVCGKRFTQKSHLVTHKRIHTGEKPFSCSTCGKSFTDKSNLVTHERTHTGLKPYSCPGCGKSFARKSYLIDHQREQKCDKLVWYFKDSS